MRNCRDAVERILEAAPAELRGTEDSPLSRHLAGCAMCRARADALLAEQDRLEHALAGIRPARSPEEAVRRARSTARDRARRAQARQPEMARRPGSWIRLGVPLAAAAAAAAILLTDRRDTIDRAVPPVDATRLARAAPSGVAPESDRPYAVFETDDPDISVIWFFEPEGETP